MPSDAQLVAHGRIDARVAARDLVAGFARERGQASHERAADAEDMDVHPPDYRGLAAAIRAGWGGPPQFGKRSRSFIFQNLPVDVRGTASMNS